MQLEWEQSEYGSHLVVLSVNKEIKESAPNCNDF